MAGKSILLPSQTLDRESARELLSFLLTYQTEGSEAVDAMIDALRERLSTPAVGWILRVEGRSPLRDELGLNWHQRTDLELVTTKLLGALNLDRGGLPLATKVEVEYVDPETYQWASRVLYEPKAAEVAPPTEPA